MIVLFSLASIPWWAYILAVLVIVFIRDVFFNRHHTITRNFPIVGHFRYMFETVGPELRQYIVANNREELPFDRSERAWIYSSAKKQNNYQGFGTDQDQSEANFVLIKPNLFPYRLPEDHINLKEKHFVPAAKIIGPHRKRPYRPHSVINISAMSYGSLSANAISSLNQGSMQAGCYHNTGEGGLSPYHSHGADVCFQFGTGYFGVRDENGNFDMDLLVKLTQDNPFVRMIELKLSQGAKPGKGGVLPGKKITAEIAKIRNVKEGVTVLSPSFHTAFDDIPSMLDFIEEMAERTGIPVGIKSAVGKLEMWHELAKLMVETGKGPDFIAIDGGEGGTGAAPPSFADHVSLPFIYAFSEVYQLLQSYGLTKKISLFAAGKLGFPGKAAMAFAMGADGICIAREAMLSIGCIQAQKCHDNSCPAGIATQSKWLQRGIDVPLKSERFANYVKTLRKELLEVTQSSGYEHPSGLKMSDIKLSMGDNNATKTLEEIFGYTKDEVEFIGTENIMACPYLGARPTVV